MYCNFTGSHHMFENCLPTKPFGQFVITACAKNIDCWFCFVLFCCGLALVISLYWSAFCKCGHLNRIVYFENMMTLWYESFFDIFFVVNSIYCLANSLVTGCMERLKATDIISIICIYPHDIWRWYGESFWWKKLSLLKPNNSPYKMNRSETLKLRFSKSCIFLGVRNTPRAMHGYTLVSMESTFQIMRLKQLTRERVLTHLNEHCLKSMLNTSKDV